MFVELILSCAEAGCKCFTVHRGYNGDSLIGYLRKPDDNIFWFYYRTHIELLRQPPVEKPRFIDLVPSANQECGSCWEVRDSLFALPCDHLVCSR